MAMKIEVVSDVSKVVADTAKLADTYDDVSDALKDLAKDGEKAGDKIEQAFRDGIGDELEKGLKDGERAAKDLERKADAAFDSVSADARKAGRDVGKSQKEGFAEAGEGLDNFKEEANSTAKESAASFDGSADSILGSFQEIAANAFAGFGPAGAAAGLAMAAGIGIAVTAMQDTAEKATEAKQKSVDMIDAIKEAGGNLADMDLSEKIISWGREVMEDNWITFWADEASTKFQETAKDARTYGVSARDAIRAASGSAEESQQFLDKTAESWQELTRQIDRGTTTNEAGLMVFDDSAKAALNQRNALSDLRGQAEENIKTTGDAVEIYELETDALDATTEAAEKAAEAVQEKADASNAAADAALAVVGAENDWITTLAQMNKDISENAKTLDVNTEAGRANRESLVEIASSANDYRDSMIAAGGNVADVSAKVQAQRDAFIASATAITGNADEAAALADKYGLIPGNVETLVQANGTEEAKAAIDSIPDAKDATVTTTETGAAEAQGKIDAVAGKEAVVTTTETGADSVQARIEDVEGKDVKIDVQDFDSIQHTQQRIDGLKGKDVPVNVRLANEQDIRNRLDALTSPRTVTVTIQERKGVPVV